MRDYRELRHTITILRLSRSTDGFGAVDSFASVGTLRARKRDLSDAERYRADEIASAVMTRFQVRDSALAASITPKDRIECEGRTFNVTGVKAVGDGSRFIEITCTARTDK
ncbi:MAG: phage head closure protein [Pseudomonadota bacterium]